MRELWPTVIGTIKSNPEPLPPMDVSMKTAPQQPAPELVAATNGNAAATTNGSSASDSDPASELARLDTTIESMLYTPGDNVADWDDIILDEAIKDKIAVAIHALWASDGKNAQVNGILLFGSPGTGKSVMILSLVAELRIPMYMVDSSSIMSKWQGDSDK